MFTCDNDDAAAVCVLHCCSDGFVFQSPRVNVRAETEGLERKEEEEGRCANICRQDWTVDTQRREVVEGGGDERGGNVPSLQLPPKNPYQTIFFPYPRLKPPPLPSPTICCLEDICTHDC